MTPPGIRKDVVGKEYPPYAVTVERGKIKEFARAIGDANPFYLDDAVGRASEWGDIVAPPTFAVTFRDETADTGALLRDLGTDISRLLHGEQEFELHRQIRPGETFVCRTKILDVYEKTGKSGPMAFVVRETAVTDRTNEIVATMRHITVVRL
ncbi:MAG: MaoC family dehydratase N-terminal domain-containing protein [Candidatus Rokubacteria bacterium]|nr:MaoC family dehydratase N-terminal domain-containing protein [Candidatus Rokubacteria bacterium]